jgi:hypothetical protein
MPMKPAFPVLFLTMTLPLCARADFESRVYQAQAVADEAKQLHDQGKISSSLFYQAQDLPALVYAADGGNMDKVAAVRHLLHLSPACVAYSQASGIRDLDGINAAPSDYPRELQQQVQKMWTSCVFHGAIDDRQVDSCIGIQNGGSSWRQQSQGVRYVAQSVEACKLLPACVATYYQSVGSAPVAQDTIGQEMAQFQKDHANAERNCDLLQSTLDKAAKDKMAEGDRRVAAAKGKIHDVLHQDHNFEYQQFLARNRLPRYVRELDDAKKSAAQKLGAAGR